jgi:hypothetical protein
MECNLAQIPELIESVWRVLDGSDPDAAYPVSKTAVTTFLADASNLATLTEIDWARRSTPMT